MLVSLEHRIALLAMPKTATTSLESVLAGHCDIALRKSPGLKHMPLRKFERFVRPLLASMGAGDVQTACLFRDPASWLASWHAYRARDAIAGTPKSTKSVSFDGFVAAYLSPEPPVFAQVGQQSRFVSRADGTNGIDHLFAYENLDAYLGFLQTRFGLELKLPRLNTSAPGDRVLSAATRRLLEKKLARDFEIHRALLG